MTMKSGNDTKVVLAPVDLALEARYGSMCHEDMCTNDRFIWPKPLSAKDEIKNREKSGKIFRESANKSIQEFHDTVDKLKKATGIMDEVVIGCYLCNYHSRYICGRFHNAGCRSLEQCNRLAKVVIE